MVLGLSVLTAESLHQPDHVTGCHLHHTHHQLLRTLELPSALRERLASPLDTMSSFLKLQLVMHVVKGTACNMVRLMERPKTSRCLFAD